MHSFNRIRNVFRGIFRRRNVEGQIEEEIQTFLSMAADEKDRPITENWLGGISRVKESIRDIRSEYMFDGIVRDVRYSVRVLAGNPTYTFVAIAALTLAIGGNISMFSVIDTVLLRPLPFPNPSDLVALHAENVQLGKSMEIFSRLDLDDFRTLQVFESLTGYQGRQSIVNGEAGPERLNATAIDGFFFATLGTPAEKGRWLNTDDFDSVAKVAVVSHKLWLQRFAGDTSILGREIVLDSASYNIIGVMPDSFDFPEKTDLWVPRSSSPMANSRGARFLKGVARLRYGVSLAQAQTSTSALATALNEMYPQAESGYNTQLMRLQDALIGDSRLPLLVLSGAVAAVLLIAVINVGMLMFAHTADRRHDIAIRMALGASRQRIVRENLILSLMIATGGAVGGLIVGRWILKVLLTSIPPGLPRIGGAAIDGRGLLFTLLLTIGIAAMFAISPSLSASRSGPNDELKGGRPTGSPPSSWVRNAAVGGQVALTLMVASAAVLLFTSFRRLQSVDLGFQADNIVTFSIDGTREVYSKSVWPQVFKAFLGRLQADPAVRAAGISGTVPLRGFMMTGSFKIEGSSLPPSDKEEDSTSANFVSRDYFKVFGIPLLEGRVFGPEDRPGAPVTVIVNRRFAHRFFPGGSVIGQRVSVIGRGDTMAEIVGVVGDVHQSSHRASPTKNEMYMAVDQFPDDGRYISIRTAGSPHALMAKLPGILKSIDSRAFIQHLATTQDLEYASVAEERFRTSVVTAYSGTAILLAAIGIYGVVAYSVVRRRREISIRMAVGGCAADILSMVVREAFAPCLFGLVLGFAGSLGVARMMRSLLFGLDAASPRELLPSLALVGIIALVACLVPARKSTSVAPAEVLREI